MTTIRHGLLSLLVFTLWIKGLTDGSDVYQTPILWKDKGDAAIMQCNHTKGATYFQMYWFRQLPGKMMELIVFTTTAKQDNDFGDFSKDKYSATKSEPERGTFTVKNLQPEDKGLYFCAVSEHSDAAYFGQGTKLTVLEGDPKEPTVQVLGPSKKECRSDWDLQKKKTLTCVASDFYPDHVSVSWQLNGVSITVGVATDSDATKSKTSTSYRISSRLQVSAEDWYDPNNLFNCTVSFYNGTETSYHHANITGEEDDHLTRKEYLTVTGNAKLSYTVLIVKSCVYGAFVWFLVRRLQSSPGK
ncbi:immunoglobulin lambda-1 light chain-like [Cololabis saira]|uniref:immunoglobulin lambda-1 light chain-like n=1 Tax=Cololabis saira TaxID=129043 RepID=UPI002AD3BF9B|nr:immunoglobulin lambda-1 light chain-like [Cololabis saira]